ncbi:hypothetical protein N1851_028136 [Merluccius polli]|uniref:Uncharacterized protein n=1 Tax=Merluccius polli TaxID=89951 RepID=A0AA47M988_MERPO|nr:hypothetical protein N1851_028136 [Merluccius polli]
MTDGQCRVGFVLGKAKLASQPEPTIPRLELCGAVLAVEMAELILDELDHKPDAVKIQLTWPLDLFQRLNSPAACGLQGQSSFTNRFWLKHRRPLSWWIPKQMQM